MRRYLALLGLLVCFASSCASTRPASEVVNPSAYIPINFEEIASGKYYKAKSYRPKIGQRAGGLYDIAPYNEYDCRDYERCSNFSSEVYLKPYNGDGYYEYVFYDDKGNEENVFASDLENGYDVSYKYNIGANSDFNPNKKYRINYRILYNLDMFHAVFEYRIYLDSIEELLTIQESEKKNAEEKAEQEKAKELQLRNEFEADYQNALNQEGVDGLVAFLLQGRYSWYNLHEYDRYEPIITDSRKEIARRLTNNQNINFVVIDGIENPYAFEKNAVYYCYPFDIEVNQWLPNGSLLCFLDDGEFNVFKINKVPDIKNIREFIHNAYLQYQGTEVIKFVNGRSEAVAVFDLLFHYD